MGKTFGVIGGDRRQAELVKLLEQDGERVASYGLDGWYSGREVPLEEAVKADVVVLPLPLCVEDELLNCRETRLPTKELFACMEPSQLVLAGQVKELQRREAAERGLDLRDYFLREELTVANAAATAEAALQVAMERLDCALLGMSCLVVGFGRIGKLLSHRLRALGAEVVATARRPEDLAWIRAYGFQYMRTDELEGLERFGLVFNTVPAPLLTGSRIERLPKGCLCVDLASAPGIDAVAAAESGVDLVWARALPGRCVPVTAARAILNTVRYMILEERSDPV